jgi:hypothetical protein
MIWYYIALEIMWGMFWCVMALLLGGLPLGWKGRVAQLSWSRRCLSR